MAAMLSLAGVQRASDLAQAAPARQVQRLLPVVAALRPLLPGLRRGCTVAITPGSRFLVSTLVAPITTVGWAAVVGMPELGLLATAHAGATLPRLALVPHPGPQWSAVVAALLDGLDAVVVAPPGPVDERVASRLAARARQHQAVLLSYGHWPRADLVMRVEEGRWHGVGAGRGRLHHREVTVVVHGRGAAARPRRARLQLPGPTGQPTGASPATRPALTVVEGKAA